MKLILKNLSLRKTLTVLQKTVIKSLIVVCLLFLISCSTTSKMQEVVKYKKIKILCPAPPTLGLSQTETLRPLPKTIFDKNGKPWIGFTADDIEILVKILLDQTEFSSQAWVNLRYYRACIEGFNN